MGPERERERIERLADALCDGYKPHQFPIGRREAKALGLKVTCADEELHEAMWVLLEHYEQIGRGWKALPRGVQVTGAPPDGKMVYGWTATGWVTSPMEL